MHLSRQWNCWSLRWSWSIACRRCSNYIFILNFTPGINGLGKDNCKTRREIFMLGDRVRLKLENWQYVSWHYTLRLLEICIANRKLPCWISCFVYLYHGNHKLMCRTYFQARIQCSNVVFGRKLMQGREIESLKTPENLIVFVYKINLYIALYR